MDFDLGRARTHHGDLVAMVQSALRLPWSAERTVAELAAIQRDGFEGLFPHGAHLGHAAERDAS
ncbi:MAG: hypothetical protein ACLFXM_05620 [Acidimicrobiia bacterium]